MICHEYKCIFVHIPKTAGQSVEHVFLNLLGLTWETRAPLLLRHNDRPELGPPRLAHLRADEYVQFRYLSQEMFDEYFKFSFVRNPWSRMVSIYKYLGYHNEQHFKMFVFGDFVNTVFRKKHWLVGPQHEFVYSRDGQLLVDKLGRFEDIQSDFGAVCREIGIPDVKLPHVNSSKSKAVGSAHDGFTHRLKRIIKTIGGAGKIPDYQNYQEYYDQETIDMVGKIYSKDIDLFKYDFE